MSRLMKISHNKLNRRRSFTCSAFAAAAILLLAGQLQAQSTPADGAGKGVAFTTQSGPAEMTTTVDRSVAQIAERIRLTLSVVVPESVTVSFPEQPTSLGQLDVVDVTDKPVIPLGDQRSWTRVYELESLLSGDQQIPEIAVAFTDKRGETPQHGVVTSQSIPISITSVLEGQADPTQFRDLKGVVDLPITAPPTYTAWWIAGGTGLAIATLLLVVALRNRRQLTAEQWALAEMDRLVDEQHVEQGRVQLFYSRLTDIVRIYIERRFEIAAPRLTTDEFLAHIRDGETLSREHCELLKDFLTQADIVKFASYCPATSDGNEAMETARRFVAETAPTRKQSDPNPVAQEA